MDERVPRGAALDLPQPYQVSPFEIAIAVLELPQWRVGRACVKHITHYKLLKMFHGDYTGRCLPL